MTQWLDISLVFLLGGLISWLSMRYRFPNAVAQVVLGVILGIAVLGWVPHSVLLHDLGEIGVVLLLGVVGMGLGLPRLKAGGWAGAQVALLGIAFSIGGGYAIGQAFDFPIEETIYLSLALGATSIGITVQVLEQFGLITHRIAEIVIAAAVLDDLIVLYFLGLAHGLLGGGYGPAESMKFFLFAFLTIGGLYWFGRTATVWAFRFRLISHPFAQGFWAIAMIALGAVVTRSLGMSLVVGAFFAGLSIAGGLPESQAKKGALALRPLVLGFMPFFFVMIGVQFDWTALSAANALWLLLSVIAVGILAKTLGGIIGAASVANWRDRWLVGFGMVARGEVALVIATLGLKQGHLTQPVYAAILVMAVTAAVIGPLLMTPLAKRTAPRILSGKPN